jgi:hypothetical protein
MVSFKWSQWNLNLFAVFCKISFEHIPYVSLPPGRLRTHSETLRRVTHVTDALRDAPGDWASAAERLCRNGDVSGETDGFDALLSAGNCHILWIKNFGSKCLEVPVLDFELALRRTYGGQAEESLRRLSRLLEETKELPGMELHWAGWGKRPIDQQLLLFIDKRRIAIRNGRWSSVFLKTEPSV